MDGMRLELKTSSSVAAYLDRSRGIVWPIGSTEQHGPDGLLGTDHLCAEAIARRFGESRQVLVAPTLAVGQSHFHLAFPGSLALRPTTLMAIVTDYLASLEVTGFRRLYILNGHGGNLAPVRAALAEYFSGRSFSGLSPADGLQVRVRSWWELPTVDALRKRLYGAQEGFHVTPSEVAITQAAFPDHIGPLDLPPPEAPAPDDLLDHGGDNYADAGDFRRRFPDGRVLSHSALANKEDGEALLAAAVTDLTADYSAFLRSA